MKGRRGGQKTFDPARLSQGALPVTKARTINRLVVKRRVLPHTRRPFFLSAIKRSSQCLPFNFAIGEYSADIYLPAPQRANPVPTPITPPPLSVDGRN